MKMTYLNKANGSQPPSKTIVLFGLSDDGKPQAGVFPEAKSSVVKKAAKQLRLKAVRLSAKQLAALGTEIPPGRLYANRRSIIPTVKRDVHEKLIQFAKSVGGAGEDRGSSGNQSMPPPAGFPQDWASIAPGHQVIVQCSLPDGWWECIVIKREGEMLTVRYRDYPKEDPFTVHYGAVALQWGQPAE
jgi:hypothetical protein